MTMHRINAGKPDIPESTNINILLLKNTHADIKKQVYELGRDPNEAILAYNDVAMRLAKDETMSLRDYREIMQDYQAFTVQIGKFIIKHHTEGWDLCNNCHKNSRDREIRLSILIEAEEIKKIGQDWNIAGLDYETLEEGALSQWIERLLGDAFGDRNERMAAVKFSYHQKLLDDGGIVIE